MDGPGVRGGGFRVVDGAALVVGAAVASVHLRSPVSLAVGLGWGLVWLTFAGVAITAAGPILLLVRRYGRSDAEGARAGLGDRLWALLGGPWIVTAALRPSRPVAAAAGRPPEVLGLYGTVLTMTLGVASLVALAVLWKTWVLKPPGARAEPEGPASWTRSLGLALAIAWPLQWGFLLVVLDSEAQPAAP